MTFSLNEIGPVLGSADERVAHGFDCGGVTLETQGAFIFPLPDCPRVR